MSKQKSYLERMAERLAAYGEELRRDRYPYLQAGPPALIGKQKWVVKQGADGCRPVKAQAEISMDKNPPPLPGAKPPPEPKPPAPPPQPPQVKLSKEAAEAQRKQEAEQAAKEKAEADKKKEEEEACPPPPPPFDMLDIPDGMDAMGFKYAAKLARRWFNGRANVIPDSFDGVLASEFVDTDTIKLGWVLGFDGVIKRYHHLMDPGMDPAGTRENVYNNRARSTLLDKFRQFLAGPNNCYSGTLNTLAECRNDPQALHQRFQFQRVGVSTFDMAGIMTPVNDLVASLANFSVYAAVATADITTEEYNRYDSGDWRSCTHSIVEISHVYVYVKDVYSFNDKSESPVSQYLGHWNRHGVIILRRAALADLASNSKIKYPYENGNEPVEDYPPLPEHLDKPVDTGSKQLKKEVFYPVRNRDFRRWRKLKKRGGDFLIFSAPERIKLHQPIILDLGEVCKKWGR